ERVSPDQAEPLSASECLGVQPSQLPVFVRKVSRPTPWEEALLTHNINPVRSFLHDPTGRVSLWRIKSDVDLRRASLALNEGRSSLSEKLFFLLIFQEELSRLGIPFEQTEGETHCPEAAKLHFEAEFSLSKADEILNL